MNIIESTSSLRTVNIPMHWPRNFKFAKLTSSIKVRSNLIVYMCRCSKSDFNSQLLFIYKQNDWIWWYKLRWILNCIFYEAICGSVDRKKDLTRSQVALHIVIIYNLLNTFRNYVFFHIGLLYERRISLIETVERTISCVNHFIKRVCGGNYKKCTRALYTHTKYIFVLDSPPFRIFFNK